MIKQPINYKKISTVISILLFLFVSVVFSKQLESTMVLHMLVQMPILFLSGFINGVNFKNSSFSLDKFLVFDKSGVNSFFCISFIFVFWMIPKSLDLALMSTFINHIKYITIFLCGFFFAFSSSYMNVILKNILKFEAWAMLGRFGYGYKVAPQRLCSNYLLDDQILLGNILIILSILIGLIWGIKVIFITSRVKA